MATEKDAQIFVSGVTQYSMSSGKFEAKDIPTLAKTAYAAFCEVFGAPIQEASHAPRVAPATSQGPFRASQPQRAPAPSQGNPDIPMETKSFSMWGGDKANIWEDKEALWTDWVDRAQAGDAAARAALEKAARGKLGDKPEWHKANARRIGRAKACLKIIADGQRVSAPTPMIEAEWQPGDGDDSAPF